MKIYNAFGITPTNSFVSAGSDYYIPDLDNDVKINRALGAFEKSYKKTTEDIQKLLEYFNIVLKEQCPNIPGDQIPNLIHLFLALYNPTLEETKAESMIQAVYYFIDDIMVYDKEKDKVGIKLGINDTLFINSGIKVALDTVLSDIVGPNPTHAVDLLRMLGIGVAGLYVNKSGMGNKGWDVRACLVDEDYAGYVHLSMAYTKDSELFNVKTKENIVYCGDKLTQMMLVPVFHTKYEEIDEDKYNAIMSNSLRGDSGFGSQDVKH